MIENVESFKKLFYNVYKYIGEQVPEFKEFEYKDFLHYFLLVTSRAYTINFNGKRYVVMVPYSDMLNHELPK